MRFDLIEGRAAGNDVAVIRSKGDPLVFKQYYRSDKL